MGTAEWELSMKEKQLSLFEQPSIAGCSDCLCRDCLFWWSGRCPNGECFDDLRARENPYDLAHPGDPPRTAWTNWKSEQQYWCRGGVCYPQHICKSYVKYTGCQVKTCLLSNVQTFQDGYIGCSLIDSVGCEVCYEQYMERVERKEATSHK